MAWGRGLVAHRMVLIGAVLVGFVLALAVVGPLVGTASPITPDIDHGLSVHGAPLPPSHAAWLGTDHLGRDVWARVVAGAGYSLTIAAIATLATLVLGLAVGLGAGIAGGRVDSVLMRIVDMFLAFPALLLALLLASTLRETSLAGTSAPVVLALAVTGWTSAARLIRSKAMAVARSEHVLAAVALGASSWRVATRHVLPQLTGVLVVVATLAFAQNLLGESALSYLGLGPPPPTPTWGRMLSEAQDYYRTSPHLVLAPGIAMVMTIAGFYLLGEGLRALVDPRRRGA